MDVIVPRAAVAYARSRYIIVLSSFEQVGVTFYLLHREVWYIRKDSFVKFFHCIVMDHQSTNSGDLPLQSTSRLCLSS